MYNNELYHHGVLGMKWGVRKNPGSSSGRSKLSTAAKVISPIGYASYKGGKKLSSSIKRNYKPAKTAIENAHNRSLKKKHDKAMDVRTNARYTYKQRKLLSDSELRYRIGRLQAEQTLRNLAKNESRLIDIDNDVTYSTGKRALQKGVGTYGAKLIAEEVMPGAGAFIKPPKK